MPEIQVSNETFKTLEHLSAQSQQSIEQYLNTCLQQVEDLDKSTQSNPFQLAVKSMADTIYMFNFQSRKLEFINHNSFLGYSLEELTGENSLFANVLADDIEILNAYWKELYSDTQASHKVNCQVKDKNGDWHWIKIRDIIITRLDDNRPERVLFHLTDITGIKQSEEQARMNAKRHETILYAMNEGVVFQRADGTIETCNPAAESILGITFDQTTGKVTLDPDWRAIHEDGSAFPIETRPLMVTLQTGKAQSNIIMGVHKPDNELTWISINTEPVFADDELLYGVVATFTDITNQRFQEDELRKLTQAVEQSPVSVMITDTDAKIIYVNPRFSQLTGYSKEEALHSTPRMFQSGMTPRTTYDSLWSALHANKEWQGEFFNKKKSGENYWTHSIIAPIINSRGEVTHYMALDQDVTEKKWIEQALLETEARYRTLFDHSKDVIILTIGDGKILDVNQAGLELFGYSYDEFLAMQAEELYVHREDREAIKLMIDEKRGAGGYDVRLKKKDGTAIDFHASSSFHSFANDDTTLYHTVMRDVTEQRRAQKILYDSEKIAREFQDHLLTLHTMGLELAKLDSLDEIYRRSVEMGLMELDFDRVGLFLVDYNEKVILGTYGTDPEGLLRNEYDYRSPLETQELWINEVLQSKEHATIWENVELMDYNKAVAKGWNGMAALWEGDQAIGFFAVDNFLNKRNPRPYERELLSLYGRTVGHVVARRHTLDTIRKSEHGLRTLLENAPLSIFVIGLNGSIEISNQNAARLFAYAQSDDLLGLKIDSLIPNIEDKIIETFAHTDDTESYFPTLRLGLQRDLFGQTQTGNKIPLEVSLTMIVMENGTKILCFVSDLSDHIQVEDARVLLALEHERSNVLSRFIRDASHEFRTPLSVIKMKTYLLEKLTDADRRRDQLHLIDQQVDSIERLINDLAFITQLESGQSLAFVYYHVNHLIDTILSSLMPQINDKQIQISLELADNVPNLRGNVDALKEAFQRVIDNAIRYSKEQGIVKLHTELTPDAVIVTIEDSGIGIESQYLDRVFERFFRVDEAHSTRGFGLGLSIADKVIQLHEGRISIKSEIGKGTIVTISLPCP